MKNKKLAINELTNLMTAKHKKVSLKILDDYKNHIELIPGSFKKHHYWKGGYLDHLVESMNLAVILYEALNSKRGLHFTLSSALFTLFIHDFDKLIRYKVKNNKFFADNTYGKKYLTKTKKILKEKYGYKFTTEELNAIKYVHGEGENYHPTKRIMLPLGCLIHCCDIMSARIWFDKGKGVNW